MKTCAEDRDGAFQMKLGNRELERQKGRERDDFLQIKMGNKKFQKAILIDLWFKSV